MIYILIHSAKGGVGKTFIACNLTKHAWKQGYNVALLDLDIHNPCCHIYVKPKKPKEVEDIHAQKLNPYKAEDGFNFFSLIYHFPEYGITWDEEMTAQAVDTMLNKVKWNSDYLVIDLPPGTDRVVQTAIRNIKEKGMRCKGVVISVPHTGGILGAKRAIDVLKTEGIEIVAVVENLSDFPLYNEHIDEFCKQNGYKLIKIPCLKTNDMNPNPLIEGFLTSKYDWSELVEVVFGEQ